jgi:hypothetical protein
MIGIGFWLAGLFLSVIVVLLLMLLGISLFPHPLS